MRLCVSNIAWDSDQDEVAADILASQGIDAVEIAPTKYWPAPCKPTAEDIDRRKQFWTKRRIPIRALQALLFGMPRLNIFDPNAITETREYLTQILTIGAALGAQRFVFGSPKNRDRGDLSESDAFRLAVEFFSPVAEAAQRLGVVFCIEPNPPEYACNFMTNTVEALAVVKAVDHPGIGLHLDTGIMTLNRESAVDAIDLAENRLCHFHISAPQLAAVTEDGVVNHTAIANALHRNDYTGAVSVEMRSSGIPVENLTRLKVACEVLNRHYRD
jgi:D-psicose/D-tagatose/L-ribulose 3-epimerase